jgi:hypothetical protein
MRIPEILDFLEMKNGEAEMASSFLCDSVGIDFVHP